MDVDQAPTPGAQPTRRARRRAVRDERWQRRIARWEARRAGPPPPRRTHRAAITLAMMVAMLALLALLILGAPR